MKTFNNDVNQFHAALLSGKEEIKKSGKRSILLPTKTKKTCSLSVSKAEKIAVAFGKKAKTEEERNMAQDTLRLINRHHTSMKGKLKGFTKFLNFIFHHRVGKSHTKDSVKAYKAVYSKQATQLMAKMHELKEGASDKEVIAKVADSLKTSETLDNGIFAAIAQLSSKYPKQYLNLINGIKDTQIVSEEVMSDLAAFTPKARAAIIGYKQKAEEEPVDGKPLDENNPVQEDLGEEFIDLKLPNNMKKPGLPENQANNQGEQLPVENPVKIEEPSLLTTITGTLTNFISPVTPDAPPAAQERAEQMKQLEAAIKELTEKSFTFSYQNAGANAKVNFEGAKKQLAELLVNFDKNRGHNVEVFALLDQAQNAQDIGALNALLKQVQDKLAAAPKTQEDLKKEHLEMLQNFKSSITPNNEAATEVHKFAAALQLIDGLPTFTMANVSLDGILENAHKIARETNAIAVRVSYLKNVHEQNQVIANAQKAAVQAKDSAAENYYCMKQIQNGFALTNEVTQAVQRAVGKPVLPTQAQIADAQQELLGAQDLLNKIQQKYGAKPKADSIGAARLAFAQNNVDFLTKLNDAYRYEGELVNARNAEDAAVQEIANLQGDENVILRGNKTNERRKFNADKRLAEQRLTTILQEVNQLNQKLIPLVKVQYPKAFNLIVNQNVAVKNQMLIASKENYENMNAQVNPLQGLKEALSEIEKPAKLSAELEQIAQENIPTSVFELIPAKAKESPESLKSALDTLQSNVSKVTPFYWNIFTTNQIDLDSIFDRKLTAVQRGNFQRAFITAMLDPALEKDSVQIENGKIVKIADKYFQ